MVLFYANENFKSFSLNNYFNGKISYYTKEIVSENSIDLGFCYLTNSVNKPSKIIGESITIENLEISTALKTLKASVKNKECLEDGTVVLYAYSPLIKSSNNSTNLQIAIKKNVCIIGWPLILGSF